MNANKIRKPLATMVQVAPREYWNWTRGPNGSLRAEGVGWCEFDRWPRNKEAKSPDVDALYARMARFMRARETFVLLRAAWRCQAR